MALPSSPPLLPEADLPTILPSVSGESASLPVPSREAANGGPSLKRQFSDCENFSSDPVFSEGISETEGESYEDRPRRKRHFKGPWWDLSRGQTLAKRAPLRVVDSGVWMGSDGVDGSDVMSSDGQQIGTPGVDVQASSNRINHFQAPRLLHAAEMAATNVIASCLETGEQAVDLSALGLIELSDDILKPLHQLIRHVHNDLVQAPSEAEFRRLTASLRLFLFGNRLSSVPRELTKLSNMTVLSLRNNHLTEIPSGICRLPRLQELHVGQNDLRFLPWETLGLLHCHGNHTKDFHRKIVTDPNPLVRPIGYRGLKGPSPLPNLSSTTVREYVEELQAWGETTGAFFHKMKEWYSEDGVPWTMRHELELRLKLGRVRHNIHLTQLSDEGTEVKLCDEQIIYLASSPVRFFDVDGSHTRTTDVPKTSKTDYFAVEDPLASAPPSAATSEASSLLELAFRSAQANSALNLLTDDLPPTLEHWVRQATQAIEYGNEPCHVCSKHYVIPRAEWVEYWFIGYPSQEQLTHDTVFPFMRRVCSWQCAQPSDVAAIGLDFGAVRGEGSKQNHSQLM